MTAPATSEPQIQSLSARRAWIEISRRPSGTPSRTVALRKESVDRNASCEINICIAGVALRKESVDRNNINNGEVCAVLVALRKESVDRNRLTSLQSCPC